jgi:hypothetical protein
MMDAAVGTDRRLGKNLNRANVRNQRPRANAGTGMQVDVCDDCKKLFRYGQYDRGGQPEKTWAAFSDASLHAIERERPEPLRPESTVALHFKPGEIRTPCAPLAFTGPGFDCISVVFHGVLGK